MLGSNPKAAPQIIYVTCPSIQTLPSLAPLLKKIPDPNHLPLPGQVLVRVPLAVATTIITLSSPVISVPLMIVQNSPAVIPRQEKVIDFKWPATDLIAPSAVSNPKS